MNMNQRQSNVSRLAELRKMAERKDGFADAFKDSLSPVKILLCTIFSRLQLKEKKMQNFTSATNEELNDLWSAIMALDSTLIQDAKYIQGNIGQHKKVSAFMQHWCQASHYSFDILKCGQESCDLCIPVLLHQDVFMQLKHIAFPVPGEDGHSLPFSDVFGTDTSEEHHPSLKQQKSRAKSLISKNQPGVVLHKSLN